MDERTESNILKARRAFADPAHGKDDPHKDHVYHCHPSDLFPRGALKELITPCFLLPSIPNLRVFCPFLFPLIPEMPFPPCAGLYVFPCSRSSAGISFPPLPASAIPHPRRAVSLLPFPLLTFIRASNLRFGAQPLRCGGGIPGISHCSVPAAPVAWGGTWERMLGGKGWEEQGSWDTWLNPFWKPKPSLGRPGLNL